MITSRLPLAESWRIQWLLLMFATAATGGCSTETSAPTAHRMPREQQPAIRPAVELPNDPRIVVEPAHADLRILFVGNSHTAAHDMTSLVGRLFALDATRKRTYIETRTSRPFLVDHASDPQLRESLRTTAWDVVVLQGQKVSSSRRYNYSRDGATLLARLAKEAGVRVVMFPEWRRKGIIDEGAYLHGIYAGLASETGAEVAPVGLAWDASLNRRPQFELHAADGNHANPAGAYLTACVLYASISGQNPTGLPATGLESLQPQQREWLQEVAWETVQRQWASPKILKEAG